MDVVQSTALGTEYYRRCVIKGNFGKGSVSKNNILAEPADAWNMEHLGRSKNQESILKI